MNEQLQKIWSQIPPGMKRVTTGTVQEGDYFYISHLGAWGPVPKVGWGVPISFSLIARPDKLEVSPTPPPVKKKIKFSFDDRSECTFEDYMRMTGTTPADYVAVTILRYGRWTEIFVPKV